MLKVADLLPYLVAYVTYVGNGEDDWKTRFRLNMKKQHGDVQINSWKCMKKMALKKVVLRKEKTN